MHNINSISLRKTNHQLKKSKKKITPQNTNTPVLSDYLSTTSDPQPTSKPNTKPLSASDSSNSINLNDIPVAVVIKSRLDKMAFEKTKYTKDEIDNNLKQLELYMAKNSKERDQKRQVDFKQLNRRQSVANTWKSRACVISGHATDFKVLKANDRRNSLETNRRIKIVKGLSTLKQDEYRDLKLTLCSKYVSIMKQHKYLKHWVASRITHLAVFKLIRAFKK